MAFGSMGSYAPTGEVKYGFLIKGMAFLTKNGGFVQLAGKSVDLFKIAKYGCSLIG